VTVEMRVNSVLVGGGWKQRGRGDCTPIHSSSQSTMSNENRNGHDPTCMEVVSRLPRSSFFTKRWKKKKERLPQTRIWEWDCDWVPTSRDEQVDQLREGWVETKPKKKKKKKEQLCGGGAVIPPPLLPPPNNQAITGGESRHPHDEDDSEESLVVVGIPMVIVVVPCDGIVWVEEERETGLRDLGEGVPKEAFRRNACHCCFQRWRCVPFRGWRQGEFGEKEDPWWIDVAVVALAASWCWRLLCCLALSVVEKKCHEGARS